MSGGDYNISRLSLSRAKVDVHVLSGIATIMIATPTNAAHPRRLYKEAKARVI